MHIEELSCRENEKKVVVSLTYNEIRDLANGLYHAVNETKDGKEFKDIADKCSFLFDMIKHGNIQSETARKLADCKLTDDDIDCFNEYITNNDMPTAFGNSDWCSIYRKIVGDRECEAANIWRHMSEF